MRNSILFEHQADYIRSGVLTIDLAALQQNYEILRAYSIPAKIAAVVKADAYGLGAKFIAPALYEMGCRLFFVAHLIEAIHLKPFLPTDVKIAVLNGIPEKKKKKQLRKDLSRLLILFHLFAHGFLFVVKSKKDFQ